MMMALRVQLPMIYIAQLPKINSVHRNRVQGSECRVQIMCVRCTQHNMTGLLRFTRNDNVADKIARGTMLHSQ